MAEEHDNWLGPATLGEYSGLLVYDPQIGERSFSEYFTYEKGSFKFFIGAEAIVKIHRGINER